MIRGCYSGPFGAEGELLGEKNWTLQLGKGCQDLHGGAAALPNPTAPDFPSFFLTFCLVTEDDSSIGLVLCRSTGHRPGAAEWAGRRTREA